MIKTICYISNIDKKQSPEDINALVDSILLKNKRHNISGLLLIQNGHFFQIIEGHKNNINTLYNNISKDTRHYGLIKLLEMPIEDRMFTDYNSGNFSIMKGYKDLKKLYLYFNWIKNANYLPAENIMNLTTNFLKNNT